MKLTVEDVAQLFGVSEKTIHRWIKSDALPAYPVNSQYRFNRTELLEWASAHRVDVLPHAIPNEQQSMPRIDEIIESGGIHYGVGGEDKRSVLKAVVDLLRLPGNMDRDQLLEILMAREEMGSTAIGEGIAIPHPRNPILLNVDRPSIILCFLEHPIEFGAIDGKKVGVLFTMVCPTIHMHLNLLSRLMFVLRDPQIKKVLYERSPVKEILAEVRRVEESLKNNSR